jgi:hypothetical protein
MNPTDQQFAALTRLWKIAQGDTGQAKVLAKFLLGLYNGYVFPFDLTDFRCLDRNLFEDCLSVLEMDYQPSMEVHRLLGKSGDEFEQLAIKWGLAETPSDIPGQE